VTVGLGDLRGLFQLYRFYDSVTLSAAGREQHLARHRGTETGWEQESQGAGGPMRAVVIPQSPVRSCHPTRWEGRGCGWLGGGTAGWSRSRAAPLWGLQLHWTKSLIPAPYFKEITKSGRWYLEEMWGKIGWLGFACF